MDIGRSINLMEFLESEIKHFDLLKLKHVKLNDKKYICKI